MGTEKFDRVTGGEDKYKKKAKRYTKVKEEIAKLDAELKSISSELIPFISKAGEKKESGSVSLQLSGKNFTVINSSSETYQDAKIYEKLCKLIGDEKADMTVPAFRKVNTKILSGLIDSDTVDVEDIAEFVTSKDRAPYIKVTAIKS